MFIIFRLCLSFLSSLLNYSRLKKLLLLKNSYPITQEGLKDTFPYLDNVTVAGVVQADHDRNLAAFLEMTKQ